MWTASIDKNPDEPNETVETEKIPLQIFNHNLLKNGTNLELANKHN